MYQITHNDYLRYVYNGNPSQSSRQNLFDKWDVVIDPTSPIEKLGTLKEETHKIARLLYDRLKSLTPKINVFFSGGIDSECIVRSFHTQGIPINPIIMIHKHVPNSAETLRAKRVCKELGLIPTLIDINLLDLYTKNILYDLGRKYQSCRLGIIENAYAIELLGEPCIIGDEIQLEYRTGGADLLTTDNVRPNKWYYYIQEDQDGIYDRIARINKFPMICNFFLYTHEGWAALLLAKNIKEIVLKNRGKTSSLTTKNIMMSKEFGVEFREKTSVLVTGQYGNIRNQLRRKLTMDLLPHTIVYLEYTELLRKLGITLAQ